MRINLEFSEDTAKRYMNVYEERDDPKIRTMRNLTEVYKSLIEHKPEKKQGEVLEAEVVPAPEGRSDQLHYSSCSKLYTPHQIIAPVCPGCVRTRDRLSDKGGGRGGQGGFRI
jgi:hypothetical protein